MRASPRRPGKNGSNLLIRQVFAKLPLVFLLDNFEDNLDDERRVRGDLADLLARWIEQPGKSRLLFTCRYPFAAAGRCGERGWTSCTWARSRRPRRAS